jgi:tetratricopeptide (TPR) repeat protein
MMRHYDEALADCDAAIHADGSYGKAYLRKAQLQLMNGLLGDAIATCNAVIESDPGNTCALDYRADILEMQTKFKRAKTCTESLYNTPQDLIRRVEDTNSALTDVDSILKTCIAWNDLKVVRAELLWALGQSEEAYELTDKLLKSGGVVETSSLHNQGRRACACLAPVLRPKSFPRYDRSFSNDDTCCEKHSRHHDNASLTSPNPFPRAQERISLCRQERLTNHKISRNTHHTFYVTQ